MSQITREELAEILADTKQMWEALAAVALQVPGTSEIVRPRAKLPQVIDMVFEQAASASSEIEPLKQAMTDGALHAWAMCEKARADAFKEAAEMCDNYGRNPDLHRAYPAETADDIAALIRERAAKTNHITHALPSAEQFKKPFSPDGAAVVECAVCNGYGKVRLGK